MNIYGRVEHLPINLRLPSRHTTWIKHDGVAEVIWQGLEAALGRRGWRPSALAASCRQMLLQATPGAAANQWPKQTGKQTGLLRGLTGLLCSARNRWVFFDVPAGKSGSSLCRCSVRSSISWWTCPITCNTLLWQAPPLSLSLSFSLPLAPVNSCQKAGKLF